MNKATPLGVQLEEIIAMDTTNPWMVTDSRRLGTPADYLLKVGLMPLSSVTSSLILLQWAEPALAAGHTPAAGNALADCCSPRLLYSPSLVSSH